MRLIKMFGLAALAAVAAMAFVGATSASAETSTQLCKVHTGLACPEGQGTSTVHMALAAGTVGRLLSPVTVLCLNVLVEAEALALGNPQSVHATALSFTGCGTGPLHNDCSVTVEELPLNNLLKTGLDAGSLEALSGRARLQCPIIGVNCLYDTESLLFTTGNQHLTANETPTIELGGKLLCPNEGTLDGLLKTLTNSYILQ